MITNFNPARHLYRRGWLGLIPLIGGLIGIWLLILGMFKYKDKILILIGTLSIAFTVSLYSYIYYYFAYTKPGGQILAKRSLEMLNNLVSDIEYYKSKNGIYPDSLEQANSSYEFAFIQDPLLQTRYGIKYTKFNYKKIGDKYTLFSSGMDRIANTDDDIYPSVIYSDSSRIGLIIKRQ